jgi:hypothetical protein
MQRNRQTRRAQARRSWAKTSTRDPRTMTGKFRVARQFVKLIGDVRWRNIAGMAGTIWTDRTKTGLEG